MLSLQEEIAVISMIKVTRLTKAMTTRNEITLSRIFRLLIILVITFLISNENIG